eukprot:4269850-Amphidinium_carterae.2
MHSSKSVCNHLDMNGSCSVWFSSVVQLLPYGSHVCVCVLSSMRALTRKFSAQLLIKHTRESSGVGKKLKLTIAMESAFNLVLFMVRQLPLELFQNEDSK